MREIIRKSAWLRGAGIPVPGALSILCNGAGHPVALLETDQVEVGADVVEYFRVVYLGDA